MWGERRGERDKRERERDREKKRKREKTYLRDKMYLKTQVLNFISGPGHDNSSVGFP